MALGSSGWTERSTLGQDSGRLTQTYTAIARLNLPLHMYCVNQCLHMPHTPSPPTQQGDASASDPHWMTTLTIQIFQPNKPLHCPIDGCHLGMVYGRRRGRKGRGFPRRV